MVDIEAKHVVAAGLGDQVAEASDEQLSAERGGPIRAEFHDRRRRGVRREGGGRAVRAEGIGAEVANRTGDRESRRGVGGMRVGLA